MSTVATGDVPSRLEIKLLGGFEATLCGQTLHGFESDKVRALLSYLVVERGRWHRRERLAALLWPDKSADASLHRLRQALSNLRAVLGERDGAPLFLETSRTDVRLVPDGNVWLDVAAFDRLLAECAAHRHRTIAACQPCAQRLETAVGLCRGSFLEGVSVDDSEAFEEWASGRRQHLEANLTPVLAGLTERALRHGDVARVQHYAQLHLRIEPWAEEAHRQLMVALAQSGQRSAALRQYQRCRQALEEELGICPSAETVALAGQIERREMPPAPPEPPHNLPAQLTRLIGREAAVAGLHELLSRERLVTLVGMGGCGKTRLAVEVAASLRPDFPGGVWLVELAPVADPAQVPEAVVRALGAREQARGDPVERLMAYLRGRPALLVLDNCEHVVGACAALADRLLRACLELCILATSRETLRINGEQAWEVLPLPVSELGKAAGAGTERVLEVTAGSAAAQLFMERAAAAGSRVALTPQTAPVLASICHALEGIPLALELAATWADTYSVNQIELQLADRFALLARGSRVAPVRHQTLEALIDWSYDLLSPVERTVFLRLGVFAGGGPVAAAAAVGAGTGDMTVDQAQQAVQTLAGKSLVTLAPREGAAGDAGVPVLAGERFRMLETLRQYARRRLDASGDASSVAERHARYFLDLAQRLGAPMRWAGRIGPNELEAIDRERDNLHAALAWARARGAAEIELQFASALGWYWYDTGQLRLGMEQVAHTLDSAAGGGIQEPAALRRERANVLVAAGYMARMRGEHALAGQWLSEALQLCRALGEARGVAGAMRGLAWLGTGQDDYASALALMEEALAIYRAVGDEERVAWTLQELGWTAALRQDPARARPLLEESLARFTRLADLRGAMYAHGVLGVALLDLGDLAGAQKHLAHAVSLVLGVKDRLFANYVLETCAALVLEAGLPEHALALLGSSAALRERNAHQPIADQARRVERALARAREALSPDPADAAWRRGQQMPPEEALAGALPPQPPFKAPAALPARPGKGIRA